VTAKPATLDDLLAAIQANTALNVDTAEACRRLAIGEDQLRRLVGDGEISRIPHLRGRGNGWLYSVKELERFADAARKRARTLQEAS
jgi:hypothetical protein